MERLRGQRLTLQIQGSCQAPPSTRDHRSIRGRTLLKADDGSKKKLLLQRLKGLKKTPNPEAKTGTFNQCCSKSSG